MSLRSLVTAFADGVAAGRTEREARPDLGELASNLAYRAVEKTGDAWWSAQGGPWLAQYHHSAALTAIGIAEGEKYSVNFTDPADALEHFRQLPDRYRTDPILRQSCLITYTDAHWYCAEPFAEDADHQVDVLRAEVARDMGRQRGRHGQQSDG